MINFIKRLFGKKPEPAEILNVGDPSLDCLYTQMLARPLHALEERRNRWSADEAMKPRAGRLRADKTLSPTDVETICAEEEIHTVSVTLDFDSTRKPMLKVTSRPPYAGLSRGTYYAKRDGLRSEIARLKRNKKRFSHVQAELDKLEGK